MTAFLLKSSVSQTVTRQLDFQEHKRTIKEAVYTYALLLICTWNAPVEHVVAYHMIRKNNISIAVVHAAAASEINIMSGGKFNNFIYHKLTYKPVSIASQSQTLLVYESVKRGFTILQFRLVLSGRISKFILSSSILK